MRRVRRWHHSGSLGAFHEGERARNGSKLDRLDARGALRRLGGLQLLCFFTVMAGILAVRAWAAEGKHQASATFAVIVRDSADVQPIVGARVFILSAKGTILSEGRTSKERLVRIRRPSLAEHPTFLFAEAPSYLISGYRWDESYDERLIVLSAIPFG